MNDLRRKFLLALAKVKGPAAILSFAHWRGQEQEMQVSNLVRNVPMLNFLEMPLFEWQRGPGARLCPVIKITDFMARGGIYWLW
jgi:hypothetical protein